MIADIAGNHYVKVDFEKQIREVENMRGLHNILRKVSDAEITLKNKIELNELIKEKFKTL